MTSVTTLLDPAQKVIGAVPGVIGAIVWLTHGLQSVVGKNGLSSWVDSHPLGLLLIAVGPILFSVVVVGIGLVISGSQPTATTRGAPYMPLLIGTSTLSVISTLLLGGFILTVVLHPSWCPEALCPQPPGPHDQYLEAQLTTIESTAFVIPNDPKQYSLDHLPATSDASTIAVQPTMGPQGLGFQPPYRMVIRVHSLQRDNFGMFLESVQLKVRAVKGVPQPLRVWMKGAPLDYKANPYRAKYGGETLGMYLATVYEGAIPNSHVQLRPGESDELGITLTSELESEVTLQAVINYRISNEQQVRQLALPYAFAVVFSNTGNWQRYELRGGRFTLV